MSTTATHPAILTVPGAPEGIVRLFVPDGIVVSKGELRTAASRVAHTIDVGRTPAGKVATFRGVKGTGYDFAPVAKGTAKAEDAPAAAAPADTDPRVVALRTLGLSDEQIAAALAVAAPAASGKGTSKGKGTAKREVPSFIAERAARREAAAKQCGKCLGFGKVRATPKPSGRYPYAFRTANGAASAPTGIVCDQCHGAAKTA